MIKLGHFLQDQGFGVSENAFFGGVLYDHADAATTTSATTRARWTSTTAGRATSTPPRWQAVDPIIADLRDLGFRTIWRAEDHYDHLHVDIANSGPIGAGSGGADGGFTGPLEDTLLEVRLIDYNATVRPVLRLRRPDRRLLRRPARSEGRARDLHGGA